MTLGANGVDVTFRDGNGCGFVTVSLPGLGWRGSGFWTAQNGIAPIYLELWPASRPSKNAMTDGLAIG